MSQELVAPIVSVTVYPGQARVTRRGSVTLAADGPAEVVLGHLPRSLVAESVRVSGQGAGSITGIEVSAERHATSVDDRVAGWLAEQRRLQLRATELADARRVLEVKKTLLESVATETGRPFGRLLAGGGDGADVLADLTGRLGDQLAQVLAEQRELIRDEELVAEELARVARDLQAAGSTAPDRTQVLIGIEGAAAGEAFFEVSYLVNGASWEPRYDLRLADDEVEVTWFGMVTQSSQEDWPACELRLSTARPTTTIEIPELMPWTLTHQQPAPRMAFAAMSGPTAAPMDMRRRNDDFDLAEAAAGGPPPPAPMAAIEATMEEGVTAATYIVGRPVAVPTDSSAHQALITSFRLPASLDHVIAPVRSDDVYLRAKVTNSSAHTLRAGRASLFHDDEFVGVTDLEVLAPGEELELALGLDDRVRVKRELVARKADKALLGGTSRQEAQWRTTVSNHTGKPARITVIDQVPVSTSPQITVKSLRLTPEVPVGDVGEVQWTFELADGESKELSLAVSVEIAKGATMIGWRE